MTLSIIKKALYAIIKRVWHGICVAWKVPAVQSIFWTYVVRWLAFIGLPAVVIAVVAEIGKAVS